MNEEAFEQHVEMLAVFVENFVAQEGKRLSQAVPIEGSAAESDAAHIPEGKRHPKAQKAIEHINENLSDSTMTVAGIARKLHISPTYLSHLFAEQLGTRMHRYITLRRIEQAKILLTTTNHPIKRVAHETGHGSADWFTYLFRKHTGITPGQFRRKILTP